MVGHANGAIQGNMHVRAKLETPMANAWLTVLHRLGVDDVEKIGDSTGEITI